MGKLARAWQVTWHVLAILAGLVALFVVVVVPWFFTSIVTTSRFHFPDSNDGKTPISYGMKFRWIEFRSADGIPLKGWFVPAEADPRGTIVYGHGHNRTRVEMLPKAAFAHSLGYNGVLFDLRHQGASGGQMSTVGYQERQDIDGAVRYALAEEKSPHPVIVWGVSMGAAAALLAAADSPQIDAVISDSTFLSFSDTVAHHLRLFLHLPNFPIGEEVVYWTAWRGHFKPSDFDMEKAVDRINPRPILFIGVEGDRRMPPSIARALYAHSTSPAKMLVLLAGSRHGEGFKNSPEKYKEAVTQFLARLSQTPSKKEVRYGTPSGN